MRGETEKRSWYKGTLGARCIRQSFVLRRLRILYDPSRTIFRHVHHCDDLHRAPVRRCCLLWPFACTSRASSCFFFVFGFLTLTRP
jgi:hypothetical protein